MLTERENEIRYKWNAKTQTGYRLRFDETNPRRHYHVEDWTHRVVMDKWRCSSLDEALGILRGFIDIDVGQERSRLQAHFPSNA